MKEAEKEKSKRLKNLNSDEPKNEESEDSSDTGTFLIL